MQEGKCAYCETERQLCNSHAIPHSVFKKIHRAASGQALTLDTSGNPPALSNESGADLLLCECCEAQMNTRFDAYGYNWMNCARKHLSSIPSPRRSIPVDPTRMAQFIASVLWRCSISSSKTYRGFSLPPAEVNLFLSAIAKGADPFITMSFSIKDIFDGNDHYSQKQLETFIFPPIGYDGSIERTQLRLYTMSMMGFHLAVTSPRLPYAIRSKPSHLLRKSKHIFIRKTDFRKIPSYGKYIEAGSLSLFPHV